MNDFEWFLIEKEDINYVMKSGAKNLVISVMNGIEKTYKYKKKEHRDTAFNEIKTKLKILKGLI